MKSKKNISTFSIRLAQLLFAVSPLTDGNNTLFYACASTAAALFLVFIATTVMVCKEEKWKTIAFISGNKVNFILIPLVKRMKKELKRINKGHTF